MCYPATTTQYFECRWILRPLSVGWLKNFFAVGREWRLILRGSSHLDQRVVAPYMDYPEYKSPLFPQLVLRSLF